MTLSTHVLDTARGKPAEGLNFVLKNESGHNIVSGDTNSDGRTFKLQGLHLSEGVYHLVFDTKAYFEKTGQESFYPFVNISFCIKQSSEHYHVPLILSPYGYSTYRGS